MNVNCEKVCSIKVTNSDIKNEDNVVILKLKFFSFWLDINEDSVKFVIVFILIFKVETKSKTKNQFYDMQQVYIYNNCIYLQINTTTI